jgi:hypothetical protein
MDDQISYNQQGFPATEASPTFKSRRKPNAERVVQIRPELPSPKKA